MNVPKEVNQAVATTLERDKASPGKGSKKRKYTTTFTPEDRVAIGRYTTEKWHSSSCQEVQGDSLCWRKDCEIVQEEVL